MSDAAEIEEALTRTMMVDRQRLRRMWEGVQAARRKQQPHDRNLANFQVELAKSCQRREQRVNGRPVPKYDEILPVCQRREEIAAAIRDHRVVVVCGETGSGKSTQLPKICLDLGRGVDGLIGHTQPRRIAARSVAARIAEELGVAVGREVGFKVRFTDATSPQTYIKLMTDGILLAENQHDRWLDQYDTIIVDEAHERSLNIDFLLGNLHRLVLKRRELKVIITSATIDAQRFADHFRSVAGVVPVIEVSGRTYPVDILYRPPSADEDGNEPDLQEAVAEAVAEVTSYGPGDVLVFMPTEREIHEASKTLRGRTFGGSKVDLLPLYARLSATEQQRVFQTSSTRRIVIATNVAESSLTVPGIRYVVDTGTARISRYSPKSKLQRLPIEAVSRASADQRAGRCGRIGPGICVRLYSEEDYKSRERFTPPEILRSNLADVILQTKTYGLGAIEEFPFLEPPKPESIRDGYKTLFELGAVNDRHELTDLGRKLARLPVDPRIARIVWAAREEHCLAEVLIIASALEIQDPRERPLEKQQQADEAHKRFSDEESDFLSYLKLWDFFHDLKSKLSHSQLRKACLQNFLSWTRMREWVEVHAELMEIVRESLSSAELGARSAEQKGQRIEASARSALRAPSSALAERTPPPNPLPSKARGEGTSVVSNEWTRRNDFGAIHRSLLTGFLSSIALKTETNEYQAAGGQKGFLWPGSGLASKKVKWIVAAELIETTRRFLRTVARIDPNWIEPLAGHLLTRTYTEPHWDAEALAVMAHEKVSLFGLLIVPRRQVRFGRIDPAKSRELFLWQGLVHGEWGVGQAASLPVSSDNAEQAENLSSNRALRKPTTAMPDFLVANRELVKRLDELESRSRKGNLLRDVDAQFDFYAARIPPEILDGVHLTQWLRTASVEERKRLVMTDADVLEEGAVPSTKEAYPDAVQMRGLSLPLAYRLDPGGAEDGVTVTVPQEGLNQLDGERLGWLVPGLIEEKIVTLLKTLPKELRRSLVPIPDTAARVAQVIQFGQGSVAEAVAHAVEQVTGVVVPRDELRDDRLPYFLRMKIRVTDANGKTLAAGRDLVTLRQELGGAAASSFSSIDEPRWSRDGITSWDFGTLPPVVDVNRSGIVLKGHPTLIDNGIETVSLRLVDASARALHELRFGVRRLVCLAAARELKQQVDNLPQLNNWILLAKTFPQPFPFRQQVAELIADRAYLPDAKLPRSEQEFRECLRAGKLRLGVAAGEVSHLLGPLFVNFSEIRKTWEKTASPQWQPTRLDVHAQLGQLFAPGFLVRTPWAWLQQFPRYSKGIVLRLQKLTSGAGPRDQQQLPSVVPRWQRGIERLKQHRARQLYDPELEAYRWMTEEYRVSIFAQELGTAVPASEKRLDQQWSKVAE
ncbi:MAG: ATP-dependent RNA helicase HrpA [Planctomycetota bacterium]